MEPNEPSIALQSAKDFIRVVIERRGALTTANIRCAAYEATLLEMSAASFHSRSLAFLLVVTMAMGRAILF